MKTIRPNISVDFTYDVHFTEQLFDPDNSLVANILQEGGESNPRKMLAVVDEGMLEHHPDLLEAMERYEHRHGDVLTWAGDPIVVPGGEQAKNDSTLVDEIYSSIYEEHLDRHSYVMIVGGGAVLDMGGYAAATAHRGIRHIRVPTTVLSQNDSGVGVKNGINAFGTKNFLGTFAPPYAVINDATFLETLEDRDWRAGISEAAKVALIKDAAFFDWLEENAGRLAPPVRNQEAMEKLIHRCAELHMEHIATSGDPFEMGSSRPLDFGHWAAHKLEDLTSYRLRHGEAVAVGIALDCVYASLDDRLSDTALERILSFFEAVGFDLYFPEVSSRLDAPEHPSSLFYGLEEFREHLGGELTIMLLENIGESIEVHEVDLEIYRRAIGQLREREMVTDGRLND
jgi:3-dehydroquinate synthase